MQYHEEETFKDLEKIINDIKSQADFHDMIDGIYEYLTELLKQPEISRLEPVLADQESRQDFIDDTLNFVGQAALKTSKNLDDKQFLKAYKASLLKFYVTRYAKAIDYRSQYDIEDFGKLEVFDDNYVIVKNNKLTRIELKDVKALLDDYLHRV